MKLDNIYIKPYNEVMGNYDKDTLMKNMVFEKGYELIVDNLIATDRRLYYANELLDILKHRINKAIELLEIYALYNSDGYSGFYKIKEGIQSKHINYDDFKKHIEDILRGEDNE